MAPDFLLVHESVCDRLLVELQRAVERQWGSDPRFAVDYPRMVDGAHARRVAELLSTAGGETVCGGEVLEEERYVAPTIVLNPDPQSRSFALVVRLVVVLKGAIGIRFHETLNFGLRFVFRTVVYNDNFFLDIFN